MSTMYTFRFFSLQNAVCLKILTYLVPVLFIFYIQNVLKLKNNSGAKRLKKEKYEMTWPLLDIGVCKSKGKVILVQARCGPEGG